MVVETDWRTAIFIFSASGVVWGIATGIGAVIHK
jgi:hypothetical protein